MNKPDHMVLIRKALTGELTSGERRLFDRWLQQPSHAEEYQELKKAWEQGGEPVPETAEEKFRLGKVRLMARVHESLRQEATVRRLRRRMQWRSLILLLLALSTGALAYLARPTQPPARQSVVLTTGPQSRAVLPDSSVVGLTDASTLTYTDSHERRESTLVGEAFFSIAKDRARPFLIHAGEAEIKVAGTRFVVSAFPGSPLVVTVIDGEVEVTSTDQKVMLTGKDEQAVLDGKLYKTINRDPNVNGWYTGDLKFDNIRMDKILKTMENHFHVSFIVQDRALLQCHFTGTFPANGSVDTVLEVLAETLHFTVEKEQNTYRLNGGGCNP